MFFGTVGAVGSAASVLGATIFNRFSKKIGTRRLIYFSIILGVLTTLFDLIYFTPFILNQLSRARVIYLASAGILSILGTFIVLTMLNLAAVICPKYSEGTIFAALMSVWNLGQMGSAALGGWLFDQIGLQPLIFVSAAFTALAWPLVRFLKADIH